MDVTTIDGLIGKIQIYHWHNKKDSRISLYGNSKTDYGYIVSERRMVGKWEEALQESLGSDTKRINFDGVFLDITPFDGGFLFLAYHTNFPDRKIISIFSSAQAQEILKEIQKIK